MVYDLLGDSRQKPSLKVREHMVDGPYVEGLTTISPVSVAECDESLRRGISHRITTYVFVLLNVCRLMLFAMIGKLK